MMIRIFKGFTVMCLSILLSTPVFAATQGSVGATSTATKDISVTIPKLIRISNVVDCPFGTYSGSGDLDDDNDVCLWMNDPSTTYKITATTDHGSFVLDQTPAVTNKITFTADWNDVTGTTGQAALTYGTALTSQSGAHNPSGPGAAETNCSGGNTANLDIHIDEAQLQAAPPGLFEATMTIVVEPE